jgi:hypothetical protein
MQDQEDKAAAALLKLSNMKSSSLVTPKESIRKSTVDSDFYSTIYKRLLQSRQRKALVKALFIATFEALFIETFVALFIATVAAFSKVLLIVTFIMKSNVKHSSLV